MDEYIRYYYRLVGDTKSRNFGDITERLEIKKKNNCKPFRWLIENIYPNIEIEDKIKDTTAKVEAKIEAKVNTTAKVEAQATTAAVNATQKV
jgi:CRISPR/Cas system CSM-associated protein Csm3 (group 7 of RAMP superfamily)